MVTVNATPPAFAEFGLREVMGGTGFDGGGGGGGPPEPPEPPPQPADNSKKTRHVSTSNLRRVVVLVLSARPFLGLVRSTSLNMALGTSPQTIPQRND